MEKYKICILCNFGPYPTMGGSVGGSEAVIAAIAEGLIKDYNYEIDIYAHNYKEKSIYNGINLFPCPKGDKIIDRIAHKYSHIFAYSDSQWNWGSIIRNIDKIDCTVSCSLVGAYYMRSHSEILPILKKNISKISLITHSSVTGDYKWCSDNNLPVTVIPNMVNLSEFRDNTIDFRKKYGIKEKYLIINVANYFYGKGQEFLPRIYKRMVESIDDFVMIQISNQINYPYEKVFLSRCQKASKGLNIRFLRNLSREDVVAAFNSADMFAFTSRKEVAPIVVLECKAAKIPFVSMDVGNVVEQKGGIVIFSGEKDKDGYCVVNENVIAHFAVGLCHLALKGRIKKAVIDEGQRNINIIDWENIIPLYYEVFNG